MKKTILRLNFLVALVAAMLFFSNGSTYAQSAPVLLTTHTSGAADTIRAFFCTNGTTVSSFRLDTLLAVTDADLGDIETFSFAGGSSGSVTGFACSSVIAHTGDTAYATGSGSGTFFHLAAFGTDTVTLKFNISDGTNSVPVILILYVDGRTNAGTITGASPICVGSATAFSDTLAGGTWSSGTSGIATVSTTGTVTGVSTGTAIISYSATNACGTGSATFPVTVGAPSAGTISGFTSVCAVSSISLTSSGASGGTWVSMNPSVATITSAGALTGATAGVDTVNYTVTNSCGSSTSRYVVTVLPLPVSGYITGPSSVCAGAAITCTDSLGMSGTWSVSSTSVATINSTTGVLTGVAAGTVVVTYTVTVSCGTNIGTRTITVIPTPTVSPITGIAMACVGGFTTLSNATSGGAWTMTNSNATIASSGNVHGAIRGLDTAVYTVTNSCGSVHALFAMVIDSFPIAATVAGTSQICPGGTTTLHASITGGAWSLSDSIGTLSGAVYTAVSPGVDTVIYSITTYCGTARTYFPVTILPTLTPSVSFVLAPGDTVCAGDMVAFTAVPVNGGTTPVYQWKRFAATVSTSSSFTYAPSNGDIITCVMESSYQCPSLDTVISPATTLVVNPIVTPVDSVSSSVANDSASYFGQIITFYSSTTYCSSSPTFEWFLDGHLVPGATSYAFTTTIYYNDTVYCVVTCHSPCATRNYDTSNTVIVFADYLSVGVRELQSKAGNCMLYPNPNNGTMVLNGNVAGWGDDAVGYMITDVTGRVLDNRQMTVDGGKFTQIISMNDLLAAGHYFVRVYGPGINKVLPFVVEK